MADYMRLTYGGNSVDFSPREGFIIPTAYNRARHIAMDGTIYTYDWSTKLRWEVPVNNVAYADSVFVDAWWKAGYTLTFTPDLVNSPGVTKSVILMNEQAPLNMMFGTGWITKYEGTLIIQET